MQKNAHRREESGVKQAHYRFEDVPFHEKAAANLADRQKVTHHEEQECWQVTLPPHWSPAI